MLLAVDLGNSTICLSTFSGNEIKNSWKIITIKDKDTEYYSSVIQELMRLDNFDINKITDIIMCSVVPELTEVIKEALSFTKQRILVVGDDGIKTNIKISTKIEDKVGTDIIADIAAGKKLYKENFIVIDMGTAVTVNVVLKGGEYAGSAFLAGSQLSVKTLSEACSQLPLVEVKKPNTFIGSTTEDAIKTGTYYGYLGAIKEIVNNIKEIHNNVDFKIILTGGKCHVFLYDLQFVDVVVPELTLQGLYEIWKLNKE